MADPFILKLLACFGLTIIMVLVLYPIAEKLDLLDHPTGHSTHEHGTPLTGGFAIYFAMLFIAILFID